MKKFLLVSAVLLTIVFLTSTANAKKLYVWSDGHAWVNATWQEQRAFVIYWSYNHLPYNKQEQIEQKLDTLTKYVTRWFIINYRLNESVELVCHYGAVELGLLD